PPLEHLQVRLLRDEDVHFLRLRVADAAVAVQHLSLFFGQFDHDLLFCLQREESGHAEVATVERHLSFPKESSSSPASAASRPISSSVHGPSSYSATVN